MKTLLAVCSVLTLAAVTPGMAESGGDARLKVERAVGQPVFDLQDQRVGTVERYINVRGTPAAVVATNEMFAHRRLLMPADDLSRRMDGGVMVAMSDTTINDLYTYFPGQPLPVW